MHESWLQDMDIEWTTRYEELKDLWDNCHISEQERIYPLRFDPGRNSVYILIDDLSSSFSRRHRRYER